MPECKDILQHKYLLKIVNVEALFLLAIAFVLRLFLFAPQETLVERLTEAGNTTVAVEKVRVTWQFVMSTLFIVAPLTALFALMEFRVCQETLGLYFNFLTNPIGRGALLLMLALMLIEVQRAIEVIFCVLLSLCALINIAVGITYEVTGYSPETATEASPIIEQEDSQRNLAAADMESQKRVFNRSEVYNSSVQAPILVSNDEIYTVKTVPEFG